jgi:hypothetical protein
MRQGGENRVLVRSRENPRKNGGERWIRTFEPQMVSVTDRFEKTDLPVNAIDAVAHCPSLPAHSAVRAPYHKRLAPNSSWNLAFLSAIQVPGRRT